MNETEYQPLSDIEAQEIIIAYIMDSKIKHYGKGVKQYKIDAVGALSLYQDTKSILVEMGIIR